MDFKTQYPDFAVIESHIRKARVERAVVVSQALIAGLQAIVRGAQRFSIAFGRGIEAERDRRAVEADAFLKRSVPRY